MAYSIYIEYKKVWFFIYSINFPPVQEYGKSLESRSQTLANYYKGIFMILARAKAILVATYALLRIYYLIIKWDKYPYLILMFPWFSMNASMIYLVNTKKINITLELIGIL